MSSYKQHENVQTEFFLINLQHKIMSFVYVKETQNEQNHKHKKADLLFKIMISTRYLSLKKIDYS